MSGQMLNSCVRRNFPSRARRLSVEDLTKIYEQSIKNMLKGCRYSDDPLTRLNQETLNNLELTALNVYMQILAAQEEKVEQIKTLGEDTSESALDDYVVTVNYSAIYNSLIIDTPVRLGSYRTFKDKKQEWLLANLVMVGVDKYLLSHQDIDVHIEAPYSFMLVRRCMKNMSSKAVPDADNIEFRHLINNLVSRLELGTDAYDHLINISCSVEFVESFDECGTTIIVVSDENRVKLEAEFIRNNRSFSFARKH